MSKELYFNCYLGQMFVSDVSDFKFVGKVKPAFFIANEEVVGNKMSYNFLPTPFL